jgi:hypothetical protein
VAGDPDIGRSAILRHGRGRRDGVRVPVACRDRAPLRRELADELTAHAGASAGYHGELSIE